MCGGRGGIPPQRQALWSQDHTYMKGIPLIAETCLVVFIGGITSLPRPPEQDRTTLSIGALLAAPSGAAASCVTMQNTEASSATCYLPTTPQAILNPEQQASQVLPVAVAVAAGAELAGGGFGFGMGPLMSTWNPYAAQQRVQRMQGATCEPCAKNEPPCLLGRSRRDPLLS